MFRRPPPMPHLAALALVVGTAGTGCAQEDTCGGSWFATSVESVTFGSGQAYGREDMPAVVLGPPAGGGCCTGSLDVVSLGNGGSIVLGFDRAIVDGPGTDFVVFENPFEFSNDVYAELATVEVSLDGVEWHGYPCTATETPYGTCAGWRPVYLDGGGDQAVVPGQSGGDPYDLADLGLGEVRYVRITDRADVDSPTAGSFDLDAVGIVHGTECSVAP